MKKFIYLPVVIVLGIIASCERETADIQADAGYSASRWEVIAHYETIPMYGPFSMVILENTDNDSITIQDSEVKFWKFSVKAHADKKYGTFETKLSHCEVSEQGIGIKISNGKIFNSDSIYFEIAFEDDEIPYGNTYQIKGHRTGGL